MTHSMFRCINCKGLWFPSDRRDPDPSAGWCKCPNGTAGMLDVRRFQRLHPAQDGQRAITARGRPRYSATGLSSEAWERLAREISGLRTRRVPWKLIAEQYEISQNTARKWTKWLDELDEARSA